MKHVSIRLRLRRLILVLVLVARCLATSSASIAQVQPAPMDGVLARFEYAEEEFISTSVELLGEKRLFVIDTGSAITILDNRFRNRLGDQLDDATLRTPFALASTSCYPSPAMKIVSGGQEIEVVIPFVGVADLSPFDIYSERPIAGIIGMDFLKNHVLRLDLDDRFVALVQAPRDTPAEMKRIDLGQSPDICPTIRLQVSNHQFQPLLLDTGAFNRHLLLHSKTFQPLTKSGRIVLDGASLVVAVGGASESRPGIIDQVDLGEFKLRNIRVSQSRDNTIGLAFLERFHSEFDFPNRKAYFRPGKRMNAPSRINLSHFAVKLVDNKLVVLGSRGMAQEADIRVDDFLVAINGHPARDLSISEFRRLQCKTGTELSLRFERDGKPFDVVLKLEQPRNPFPDEAPPGFDFEETENK